MSEAVSTAVSALPGAAFDGLCRVEEAGLCGMITLRGELGSARVKKAVKSVAGVDVPAQRRIAEADGTAVAWMSPDELLIMVGYEDAAAALAALETSLKGAHFLAVNVSDARAVFDLSGGPVRDVMAKLVPVDMAEAAFGPGDFRRSRLAQVPAAFWMPDAGAVRIVCFRSVADYAFSLLRDAAGPGGEVGFHD